MKKRLLIVAGVILVAALAFGMGFWKEAQATNQKMEHILDLSRILTLAENRGSDWATDELMINEIETCIDHDCKLEEKYNKQVDWFFELHDQNNCERIYQEIQKIL